MKIAISGGHFSPAYATIQRLKNKKDILVIGRKFAPEGSSSTSFEYNVCKKFEIGFRQITAGRFTRNLSSSTVLLPLRLLKSISDAARILRRFKPDVVVVFGGYIALPVALSAYFLKIPVVVHEQTQKAGIANKIIGKFAARVCISFNQSRKFFPSKKTVLTGNPLRQEVLNSNKTVENFPNDKPMIYITGGSTGSHFINTLVENIIQDLLSEFVVVHQTGDSKFQDFERLDSARAKLSEDLKKRYILKRFFHSEEVGELMRGARLIVARSGINTVSEILSLGKVSLLIPLPYGQTNEQKDNAGLIAKIGLGKVIQQREATSEILISEIKGIMENYAIYIDNKERARKLVIDNAAERLIEEIRDVYEKNKTKRK